MVELRENQNSHITKTTEQMLMGRNLIKQMGEEVKRRKKSHHGSECIGIEPRIYSDHDHCWLQICRQPAATWTEFPLFHKSCLV